MPVLLNNIQAAETLSDQQLELIEAVLTLGLARHHHQDAELSVVLVDNGYMQDLNLQYRGIAQPTDVLSFAFHEAEAAVLGEAAAEIPDMLGDIYISVERALEQATRFGHSFERELCYLATHGLLHLVGYDHQQPEDTAKMREAEEAMMSEFALGRESL